MTLRERLQQAKKSIPLEKAKKFVQLNEGKIKKVVNFSSSVISDANTLLGGPAKPSVLAYATLATKIKAHYDSSFHENVWSRFAKRWTAFFPDTLRDTITKILVHQYADRIVAIKIDSSNYRFLVMDEFVIGWQVSADGMPLSMNFEEGKEKFLLPVLEKAFWNYFGDFVVLSAGSGHSVINSLILESDPQLEIIHSKKAIELAMYFQKFLEKKISRSILFYGPPGTGKSNIARSIAHTMKMKTLKFNIMDFKKLTAIHIHEIIRAFRPDVVIIEDIDHAPMKDDCQVLAVMEVLNKTGKLILATTNEVSTINHAVLRPGRFDELIEIDKFDNQVLMGIVGGDEELLELVRDFPIASTMELMTRVKVLGRAEALASIGDIRKRYENMKKNYNCAL